MSSPSPSRWMGNKISPSNSMLDDDDPGIMSEAETSSTGFRRGTRQRTSLPVVRTPSKTLERPLGLVFLQYRNETKRALLPNEITTLDTVRALFVRSFGNQLNMEYLDSRNVRIYIHDPSKNMFYELEDLRDIRDRSILRLYETEGMVGLPMSFPSTLPLPMGMPAAVYGHGMPPMPGATGLHSPMMAHSPPSNSWDPESSYFSEPEFDSDYQSQHVHKTKTSVKPPLGPGYYSLNSMNSSVTNLNGANTLNVSNNRQPYSPSPLPGVRSSASGGSAPGPVPQVTQGRAILHRSYSNTIERTLTVPSPERNITSPVSSRAYAASPLHGGGVLNPALSQMSLQAPHPPERTYSSAVASAAPFLPSSIRYPPPPPSNYCRSPIFDDGFSGQSPFHSGVSTPLVDDHTRIRMEQVERQLASLTGLVQTALTVSVTNARGPSPIEPINSMTTLHPPTKEDLGLARHATKTPPRLAKSQKEKCVSFEKSVSFCDDPVDFPYGRHSPQPTESKPTKPAIKSTTLPRASSQGSISNVETYTQLRMLQKRARDLRQEMRNLRRLSQAQSSAVKDAVAETILVMKKTFLANSDIITAALAGDPSAIETSMSQIHRQEDLYHKDMKRLEKDISDLEVAVEDLRSNVINKKTRVSMADVEKLASLLSQSSKTVGDLKTQYPGLEDRIKSVLTYQMDRLVEEERFLAEEPSKLENTMRRCKKLTSTLVTLRRLASVQEQRTAPNVPEKGPLIKSYSSTLNDSSTETVHPSSQQGELSTDASSANSSRSNSRCSTRSVTSPPLESHQFKRGTIGGGECGPPLPPRPRQGNDSPLDALLTELKQYTQTQIRKPEEKEAEDGVQTSSPQPIRRLPQLTPSSSSSSSSPPSSFTESSVNSIDSVIARSPRRPPPPPPPPRTSSSRSPLMSPQSTLQRHPRPLPQLPNPGGSTPGGSTPSPLASLPVKALNGPPYVMKVAPLPSNCTPKGSLLPEKGSKADQVSLSSRSSSSESINSQEGLINNCLSPVLPTPLSPPTRPLSASYGSASAPSTPQSRPRQDALEQRHQELLKKQKLLQDQYARLQQMQRSRPAPIAMGVRALHHVVASSTASTASATTDSSTLPHPSSAHVLAARYELKKANSESQLVTQLPNRPVDGSTVSTPPCAPEGSSVAAKTPTSPDAASISPAMIKNATETDII